MFNHRHCSRWYETLLNNPSISFGTVHHSIDFANFKSLGRKRRRKKHRRKLLNQNNKTHVTATTACCFFCLPFTFARSFDTHLHWDTNANSWGRDCTIVSGFVARWGLALSELRFFLKVFKRHSRPDALGSSFLGASNQSKALTGRCGRTQPTSSGWIKHERTSRATKMRDCAVAGRASALPNDMKSHSFLSQFSFRLITFRLRFSTSYGYGGDASSS